MRYINSLNGIHDYWVGINLADIEKILFLPEK